MSKRTTKAQLIAGLDKFTRSYIECMLWSTNDESTEQGGEPMDENYGINDITRETLESIIADCAKFQADNAESIAMGCARSHGYGDDEMAGHDFWLTRVGHGAGFWDGDWPEPAATKLTDASEAFGGVWPYVYGGRVRID